MDDKAPERIWAVSGVDGFISFNDYKNGEQEYVRADIHEAVKAERDEQVRWVKSLADELIKAEAERDALRDVISYVFQDDHHNRLTPRIVDIAYTAFMAAKKPNDEDGGASDWFNDTKPVVDAMISKTLAALQEKNDG